MKAVRLIGGAALLCTALAKPQSAMTKWQNANVHRLVVWVARNARAATTMVLNSVQILVNDFRDKGEKTAIEFVPLGAGRNTMRSHTPPAKDRLSALSSNTSVTFSGRGDALAKRSATANKPIGLVPEVHIVRSAKARVVELQEAGWACTRP
jgi:intracellular sulfur oxidation DsrE/DsrF family protein